jgi:hypothetical protein
MAIEKKTEEKFLKHANRCPSPPVVLKCNTLSGVAGKLKVVVVRGRAATLAILQRQGPML